MGDSLTRYLVISVTVHLVLSGAYVGYASHQPKTTPPVVRARIVTLPGPKAARPQQPKAPVAEKPKPVPEPPKIEKLKETVKTKRPEPKTKAAPPAKKIEKKKVEPPKPKGRPKEPPEDRRTGGHKGKIEEPAVPSAPLPGGGTASVGLDAIDFTFSYYLVTIQNSIGRQWNPPAGMARGENLLVVVHFQIERDGRIVRPVVETSSGIPFFDKTALRAVERAKLPPLPAEYAERALGVHFQFEYAP